MIAESSQLAAMEHQNSPIEKVIAVCRTEVKVDRAWEGTESIWCAGSIEEMTSGKMAEPSEGETPFLDKAGFSEVLPPFLKVSFAQGW